MLLVWQSAIYAVYDEFSSLLKKLEKLSHSSFQIVLFSTLETLPNE